MKQDLTTEQRRRSLGDISIFDLRSRIASPRRAKLKTLSAEGAAYRIGRVIDQYPFQIRSMQLNGIYRARPNKPGEVFSSASQLWYPPATAGDAPDFVEVGEAGIAMDDAMRRQRRVQLVG
jgi:hypothetical protein